MLIDAQGQTTGTISGGCLESDLILRARRAIERNETSLVTYDSTGEDDIDFGVGLGCGGVIQILIEPLPREKQPSHLLPLDGLLCRRDAGVGATVWRAERAPPAQRGCPVFLGGGGRLLDDNRGFPRRALV